MIEHIERGLLYWILVSFLERSILRSGCVRHGLRVAYDKVEAVQIKLVWRLENVNVIWLLCADDHIAILS